MTEEKEDIILQLNFLEKELKDNKLGQRMQNIFPEGYIFVNALYGLAWCEVALADTVDKSTKDRALSEALYAYKNIDIDQAKWSFPVYLDPEYGIFYHGWRNYLLSKILLVDTSFSNSETFIKKLQDQSDIIANALHSSAVPFLESYDQQSWPADMFVAMASLSNHDKLFAPRYDNAIDHWIKDVKTKLDENTDMIPHKVNSLTGLSSQGSRGCSMGLILRMLGEIDYKFAQQQYDLFKDKFISTRFGLPCIREYPKGVRGLGDIDSGPVIFGVGFSATIVMIGTLSMYDDSNLADNQYKTIHAFGFDRRTDKVKKYLFGKLPMADAFIAWGRSTGLNYNTESNSALKFWRFKFHIISLFVIAIIWIIYNRKQILTHYKTATNKVYKT
ncbi:hypothetical protein [Cognatitamlana onchidii]|uniref:hypothetical protein n=1 Tax=Cognatitamlana onchidii TaxID=2562860 RepID=UPI0010A62AA5|nr:hypothetical protein [Algibacter onchidii]